jgi:hypothetical protein
METGRGTIAQMTALARRYNDGEPWPAENFVLDAFTGIDSESVTSRDFDDVTNHPLRNGVLTRYECLQYAREWDKMGVTDVLTFVNSLACDTIGSGKGDVVAQTLQSLSFHDSQHTSESNIDSIFGADIAALPPGRCTDEALDAAGW